MPFAPLRGFRDYPPPEAGARSEIRRRWRLAARRCGFEELEVPALESLELYKVKSGEEIAKQLWAFTDKGGREVALATEATPALARVFVDRAKSVPMPVKWFTLARCWRYEEPQEGRTREFTQFNLDLLGVPGVEAEAEVLAAGALALDLAGAEGLYEFRLNDRHLAEGIGRRFGVTDPGRFFHALDRSRKESAAWLDAELAASGLAPDGRRELVELLGSAAAGVPASEGAEFLDRIAGLGLPEPGPLGLDRTRALLLRLGDVGMAERVRLDPTIVRGLAYYTGAVFEAFDRTAGGRSLFGGGRYDGLIELFGGPPTPAVGLAIGDQTMELLLRAHQRWPEGEPGLDSYVVAVSAAEVPRALALVRRLRAAGEAADCDLLGRNMSRQLREAARRKARRALVLGPKELARGVVLERDLQSGAQRELPWDAVVRAGA